MTPPPAASPAGCELENEDDLLSFDEALTEEAKLLRQTRVAAGYQLADDAPTVGLALSGGGIRSATFCLGVLQALAKADPPVGAGPVGPALRRIDYLSTVSGGGYAGSWLTAWIHRKGLDSVATALGKTPQGPHETPEAPEVSWLRRYSNYLAPRLGLLSADSMTLVATWLRNVLLNLLVLLTFLAALFLAPRIVLVPAIYAAEQLRTELGLASAWLAFFILPLGISLHFSRYFMQDAGPALVVMNSTRGVALLVILPGTIAALLGSLNLFYYFRPSTADVLGIASTGAIFLTLGAMVWIMLNIAMPARNAPRIDAAPYSLGDAIVFPLAYSMALVVGAVLVSLLAHASWTVSATRVERVASALAFGTPSLLATFGAMGSVVVGMVGRNYQERTREWWSRMNAWFIFTGAGWFALVFLSFYAAPLMSWGYANLGGWLSTLAGATWLASLGAALFAKQPDNTESVQSRLKGIALNVALWLVVAGLLFGVAGAVGLGLQAWSPSQPVDSHSAKTASFGRAAPVTLRVENLDGAGSNASVKLLPSEPPALGLAAELKASFEGQDRLQQSCVGPSTGFVPEQSPPRSNMRWNLLDCRGFPTRQQWALWSELRQWKDFVRWNGFQSWALDPALLAFLLCSALCALFSSRVDVNKFSLHNMYKNRLIRCYLGASKGEARRAHPFTGFDDLDDIALSHLPQGAGLDPPAGMPPQVHGRPLHVVNAALNITHGTDLAWQERKAASFTFSPLHCGFTLGKSVGDASDAKALSSEPFRVGGYRRSAAWASRREERKHFSLGMALATSGAAVSPLRGAGSRAATAFLTTVFNIRLGRWSPNPLARSGWRLSSPRLGLYWLFQELFGYSTETSDFVYLSDGGHFDNTGIYELVRRGCDTVLAVDASADVQRGYEDLANALRKCRVDFGVTFTFPFEDLGTEHDPPEAQRKAGYACGAIHYPGGRPAGRLIVIKPTLLVLTEMGVDLFAYGRSSASFPHQTTIDQFFSESQFESYRALGERIASTCLADPQARFW